MRKPFDGNFPKTQDWNDKCCRASYSKFGLMGHNGHDYGLPSGTRVVAPHGGKIIEATNDPTGYGNYVKIENDKEGSVLAHLSKISVKVGDQLIEGNEIGFSGNTGNSTGAHLHWGYYRIPRDRENGFLGFIDQDDWLNLQIAPSTPPVDVEPFKREIASLNTKINNAKQALA